MTEVERLGLARVFRAESGRILAALLAQYHDITMAEDALQDACVAASEQWVKQGMPINPAGWLLTVARRRLIDKLRQQTRRNSQQVIEQIEASLSAAESIAEAQQPIPDERLRLLFTCCHPALAESAQVALTLKTLCGLNAREIARAFVVSETAMNQRLTRAKRKIKHAGVAYSVPEAAALPRRLPSVLAVIYLIYNESYSAYEGQLLTREDLACEAIRLGTVLYKLLPRSEVAGLLALMLLHHSRSAARRSATVAFIPLEQQDRALWDLQSIAKGQSLLANAMSMGPVDKYQIQAAISALHVQASSWEETDWYQIQLLYQSLYRLEPSPVVALNYAIAVANSGQLQCALKLMDALQHELLCYQPYFAARADLAYKLGRVQEAIDHYDQAIAMTRNNAERDFLKKQHRRLVSTHSY